MARTSTQRPRRAPSSPERLAAQFADGQDLFDVTEAIERNAEQWERLTTAIQRRDWAGSLTESQISALEERIHNALPKGLGKTFVQYSDGHTIQRAIKQQAAFLVGLQVGLRLSGGVR